ncbi:hypothetical protein ABZT06_43280 [Streptomyces sp. NPDC005483]|uniref:hypothetical protein n=1 Tax=Streptomyces sp. NPDC005483 TaxID=3154882 RepID=UPI0033ADE82F
MSEPEMGEGIDPSESGEVMEDLVQRSPVQSAHRRPWLWALGGALTASALWAAGLHLLSPGNQGTDLRGYRVDRESCRAARLASLREELALKSAPDTARNELLRHPALDQVHCSLSFQGGSRAEPGGRWAVTTTIGISVAVHKKADPRDEFEADRRVTDAGVVAADQVRAVPDLGDEAFVLVEDLGHTELRVLDGAAVVTLSLATTSYYEGDVDADTVGEPPDLPDVSTYWPAMIDDARKLTSTFRHA